MTNSFETIGHLACNLVACILWSSHLP